MLKKGQKKLDVNKDGKISGEDFKMMRKKIAKGASLLSPPVVGAKVAKKAAQTLLNKIKKSKAKPKKKINQPKPMTGQRKVYKV
jgi:hypothetical protein